MSKPVPARDAAIANARAVHHHIAHPAPALLGKGRHPMPCKQGRRADLRALSRGESPNVTSGGRDPHGARSPGDARMDVSPDDEPLSADYGPACSQGSNWEALR